MPEQVCVIYRDDSLVAICKPSGLAAHRGYCNDAVTAADIVRDDIAGGKQVFAVHRLDRGTSGVMLFALSAQAARTVQANMQVHFEKKYLALVRGPMKNSLTLDHAIRQRDTQERVAATTHFAPLGHKDRWSLVEARPVTGRTHQIRLHLKHLSHPIVGDVRYGKGDVNRFFREQYQFARLALHAFQLSFNHPDDGRLLTLTAEPTGDLKELLSNMNLWSFVDLSR